MFYKENMNNNLGVSEDETKRIKEMKHIKPRLHMKANLMFFSKTNSCIVFYTSQKKICAQIKIHTRQQWLSKKVNSSFYFLILWKEINCKNVKFKKIVLINSNKSTITAFLLSSTPEPKKKMHVCKINVKVVAIKC